MCTTRSAGTDLPPRKWTAYCPRTRQHCNHSTYALARNRYNDPIVTSLFPLQLLLATFAGWTNRHLAQVIDYLVLENRVLKERLGKKRLRLTDDQRQSLAAKGKILGRRLLSDTSPNLLASAEYSDT